MALPHVAPSSPATSAEYNAVVDALNAQIATGGGGDHADTPGLTNQPGYPVYSSKWSPNGRPTFLYEPDLMVDAIPAPQEVTDIRDNNAYWNADPTTYLVANKAKVQFGPGPFFRPSMGPCVGLGDVWTSYSDGLLNFNGPFVVACNFMSVGADWTAQANNAGDYFLWHFGAPDVNTGTPGVSLRRAAGSANLIFTMYAGGASILNKSLTYSPVAGDFPADTWKSVWVWYDGATMKLFIGNTQKGGSLGCVIPAPYNTFPISEPKSRPGFYFGGSPSVAAQAYPYRVTPPAILHYNRTTGQQVTNVPGKTVVINPAVTQGAWNKKLVGGASAAGQTVPIGPEMTLMAALGLGCARYTTGHETVPLSVTNPGPAQTYNFAASSGPTVDNLNALGLPFHFQMNWVPDTLQSVPGNASSAPINGAPGASVQRGVYDPLATYAINDTVSAVGALTGKRAYFSLANGNIGNAPPDGGSNASWQELYPEATKYVADHLDWLVNTKACVIAGIGFINEPLSTAGDWVAPNGNADLTNFWVATNCRISSDARLTGKIPVMGTCDGIYTYTNRASLDGPAFTAQISAAFLHGLPAPPMQMHDYSGDLAVIRNNWADLQKYATTGANAGAATPVPRLTEWNADQSWAGPAAWEGASTSLVAVRSPTQDMLTASYYAAVLLESLLAGADMTLLFGISKTLAFPIFGPSLFWAGMDSRARTQVPFAVYELFGKLAGTRISSNSGTWADMRSVATSTLGANPRIMAIFHRHRPLKPREKDPCSFDWNYAGLPATFTWKMWKVDWDHCADGRLMQVSAGDQTNLPNGDSLMALSLTGIEIQG